MTTLMVQGTGSDVGKSIMVAGLCRYLANKGLNIAPFKPQNMALNSAVTEEGLEIGRAQWVQALAARQKPKVDFNPVLLKPSSDTGAQVILHGKAISQMEAEQYHNYKQVAMNAVLASHQRLDAAYDHIIVEGAGSPAEVNLREGDIANMGFAEAVDCPVILVGDIDKGGVFAQLVGTLELLSHSKRNRIKGFIINKFRGDIELLKPGLDWLEKKTDRPVLGVLPYCHELHLAAEDAIVVEQKKGNEKIKVAVLGLSRISNHTDFDLMRHHPEIDLHYVMQGSDIPPCDLIIIPGTKAVIADCEFIRQQGWDAQIARHLRYEGKVFGICGGYQILGQTITDQHQIEGSQTESPGLGYLPIETRIEQEKVLRNATGTFHLAGAECSVSGYEIHAGVTSKAGSYSILTLQSEKASFQCGVVSEDDQVAGCYLHGLFENPAATQLLLKWLGHESSAKIESTEVIQERAIDQLARSMAQHLNMKAIESLLDEKRVRGEKL